MKSSEIKSKKSLQPKLRFPEFGFDVEWEIKPLGEICDILNNKRQPISGGARKSGAYPYYGASGIVDYVENYIFDERLLLVGEDGAKWGPSEKTAFIADGKYWVNNHAHVLKAKGIIDTILESYLVMIDLSPFVTGAAPPKLTLGKLKGIPIPVSNSKKEQQKIADCLSSLDELIEAEDQKLEALQRHKKGLMQELFPSEGQTLPKRRFPEFQSAPDWEEKTLENVFYFKQGYQVPVEVQFLDKQEGRERFIRIIDVTQKNEPPRFIDATDRANILSENDLFMVRYGTPGLVSMGYRGIIANNLFQLIFINQSKNFSKFWYYNLKGKEDKIATLSGSSSMPAISFKTLEGLKIRFPSILKEQQRIADFLSSIDNLITTQIKKLESLRLDKKGLMQQLFPNHNQE